MKKNEPTPIDTLLNAGHFGNSDRKPVVPLTADPVKPTEIEVTLDEVSSYDHNPRLSDNPKYEEIKASIQQTGKTKTTIHVTRRPGDANYMINAGGNTRLQALQALYEETGDERFFRFSVIFDPWESEIRVMADHLIENGSRADLSFIDNARAVRKLKTELEAEMGETLSLRRFETQLKKLGYPKSISLLSKMDYAIDVLLPVIPIALGAGLGKPKIERLRKLHKAHRVHWKDYTQKEEGVDPIFMSHLNTLDGEELDLKLFEDTMAVVVRDKLKLPAHYVDLSIKQIMDGLPMDKVSFPIDESGSVADAADRFRLMVTPPRANESGSAAAGRSAGAQANRPAPTPAGHSTLEMTPPVDSPVASTSSVPSSITDITEVSNTQPNHPVSDRAMASQSHDPGPSEPQDITQLRHRAFETARRVAQAVDADLATCVLPYEHGLGYLVDIPTKSIKIGPAAMSLTMAEKATLVAANTTWWMLLILSEVACLSPEGFKRLPDGYVYGQLMREDGNLVYEQVGQCQILDFGKVLQDATIYDGAITELMELIMIGQSIRLFAREDPHRGRPLWPTH